ncbi:pyrroline-5-carboxylate reductase [Ideonella sp. 4Y16]|uniref:Pyrroline-5-carboxylate reductase n=1 Tax=Ideonella alba TaxID=2824118 RepID=A0A940Y5E7_9BURK|nr:pyrroline-5-carboxylate reductase [Ideonella alba]MBQ0930112.1 pyrroline-5-carboxylate reductase [Ideonella alba]MBQ0943179.1 pyrroline-5-carboxylate reductase [Ideonella alba]
MNASTSLGRTAFIGGGNMASAVLGGLLRAGAPADAFIVVEPWAEQAARLREQFGLTVLDAAGAALQGVDTVVWAVKPQLFAEAAAPCAAHIGGALQISVMAGIRSEAIARASGSAQVVRCMPNTPALIGQGMTGLHASAAVSSAQRQRAEALLAPTGRLLWVDAERDLDAVTALSGSGPAYFFYLIEAMVQAGTELGLSPAQARQLAEGTAAGAAALSAQSVDSPEVLRQRVTSKGGTTHAAISTMEAAGMKATVVAAVHAAARRAAELGDEFGRA